MAKKSHTIRIDATPHYTMQLLFIGIAAAGSWFIGFKQGRAHVNKLISDDTLADMLGGYAGMAVFFGLTLQVIGVELMRIKPMRYLNKRAGDFETRVVSYFFPRPFQPMDYIAIPASDTESVMLDVTWHRSPSDFFKLALHRLTTYAATVVVGASASLFPVYMLCIGMDIFTDDSPVEKYCLYGTLILMALQIRMMSLACRADQCPGSLSYTEMDAGLGMALRFNP